MLKDVQYVNLFPKMGDVEVVCGIVTYCFIDIHPIFYNAHIHFAPSQSLLFPLNPPSLKCLHTFWVQDPLIAHKYL